MLLGFVESCRLEVKNRGAQRERLLLYCIQIHQLDLFRAMQLSFGKGTCIHSQCGDVVLKRAANIVRIYNINFLT